MFSLSAEQTQRLMAWLESQDKNAAIKQGREEAYYGACGGSVTYSFTPTSLGLITKVQHGYTKEMIDLTDYDSW